MENIFVVYVKETPAIVFPAKVTMINFLLQHRPDPVDVSGYYYIFGAGDHGSILGTG